MREEDDGGGWGQEGTLLSAVSGSLGAAFSSTLPSRSKDIRLC